MPTPFARSEDQSRHGPGWAAAAACILEASAPKPGNVHPGAAFPDLTYEELVAAGRAIAPVMERAGRTPLGRTILDAVAASTRVTRSNANLGIILAIAPLATVSGEDFLADAMAATGRPRVTAALERTFARLSAADAADVWRAIAMARPGGLGCSPRHDLGGPPPENLLDAMRLAATEDAVARLWTEGYESLYEGMVADLIAAIVEGSPVEAAIVRAFLLQLAREPDSLIIRRHGRAAAIEVSRGAAAVLREPETLRQFDASLRSPRRLNPGTTADLTATALYIVLREGRLAADATGFAAGDVFSPTSTEGRWG